MRTNNSHVNYPTRWGFNADHFSSTERTASASQLSHEKHRELEIGQEKVGNR